MTRRIAQFLFTFLIQFLLFFNTQAQQALTPATALQGYLNNGDKTFHWELKESFDLGDVKAYNLLLTSQQWHEYIWTHQLTILVPSENNYDGALLFVTGGSNKKGLPNWNKKDDKFLQELSAVAAKNKGIVALLRQAPNQPLVGDLTEDALISYTLHKFKEDGDYSWPLLFPMVKSAVRAMDAVQEFSKQTLNHNKKRRSRASCAQSKYGSLQERLLLWNPRKASHGGHDYYFPFELTCILLQASGRARPHTVFQTNALQIIF